MPLIPKKPKRMALVPRASSKLKPINNPKSKGLIPRKPKGLVAKKSIIKKLQRKEAIENEAVEIYNAKNHRPKKPIDHEKSFSKWYKIVEDGAILLAEEITGRTKMRIVFHPILEHFLIQHIDTDNRASTMKMSFPVAIMILLRQALRRAEKGGLIKNARAIAPTEEEK